MQVGGVDVLRGKLAVWQLANFLAFCHTAGGWRDPNDLLQRVNASSNDHDETMDFPTKVKNRRRA
jgi:hypothetical protein